MRSGAPGPAPMKCTVMAVPRERDGAGRAVRREPRPEQPRRRRRRRRAPRPPRRGRPKRVARPRRASGCGGPRAQRCERQSRQGAPEAARPRRARLAGLGREREQPPLALRRAGFRQRAAHQRGDRVARDPRAAADADGDETGSWLCQPPLHDRHRRPPAGKSPDRLGVGDRDLRELAAAARAPVRRSSACVSSVTALTTSRPPGRSASQARSISAAALAPPPMKTASGSRQIRRTHRGASPSTIRQRGHAERGALRAMRAARSRRRFDRDRAVGRIGQHPFDRHRARAGADVPQHLAAPRRERGERDRADSRLVIWPSCSNHSSGRPGRAAARGRRGRRRPRARWC